MKVTSCPFACIGLTGCLISLQGQKLIGSMGTSRGEAIAEMFDMVKDVNDFLLVMVK